MITNRRQEDGKDLVNDDEENERSIEMKVLNGDKEAGNNKNAEKQVKFLNKTSLGAISEAESVMEGSKKVLFDTKNNI